MKLKRFCTRFYLNLIPLDEVASDINKFIGGDYLGLADHDKYFYDDYLAYQPDYNEKIYEMCRVVAKEGYEFVFMDDIIK